MSETFDYFEAKDGRCVPFTDTISVKTGQPNERNQNTHLFTTGCVQYTQSHCNTWTKHTDSETKLAYIKAGLLVVPVSPTFEGIKPHNYNHGLLDIVSRHPFCEDVMHVYHRM